MLLAPDNNPARYFRFAGGVTDTARYDARQGFLEDSLDPRFNQDDVTWNPEWRYECAVAADAKSWTALLVIPFQSLNTAAPTAGTEWQANFGRVHQIRRYHAAGSLALVVQSRHDVDRRPEVVRHAGIRVERAVCY